MQVVHLCGRFKPASKVSAGRVFNEQNATAEILRFVMQDQIYPPATRRANERWTIGSRSHSAVYTNEVAPYSRILANGAWRSAFESGANGIEIRRGIFFVRVLSQCALPSNFNNKTFFSPRFEFNPVHFT